MKRLVALIIMLAICVLLGLWSPWMNLHPNFNWLVGLKKTEQISGLQVYSLSGEIEVFVQGQSKGKVTPDNSPLIVDRITPGEVMVSLKRVAQAGGTFWEFNKIINFVSGTDVVISYNLGPTQEFSEGHIIYAVTEQNESDSTNLNVLTNVDESFVQIDDLPAIETIDKKVSEKISLDTRHKIAVSKNGFETLEFTILPERQEDRNIFKDYDINVEVLLMYQPVEVE